jgi:hypothetical protein
MFGSAARLMRGQNGVPTLACRVLAIGRMLTRWHNRTPFAPHGPGLRGWMARWHDSMSHFAGWGPLRWLN